MSDKARGMGIGTLLVKEVEDFAKQQNITKLYLEVVDTNPLARKLYERIGFLVTKEIERGSSSKKAGYTKVFYMQKILVE